MTLHAVRFFRHTVSGEHCAACTCGRTITGDLETCRTWAAVHDLRELPDIVAQVPYRSGLCTDDDMHKSLTRGEDYADN
jgi:hypothetical protein